MDYSCCRQESCWVGTDSYGSPQFCSGKSFVFKIEINHGLCIIVLQVQGRW